MRSHLVTAPETDNSLHVGLLLGDGDLPLWIVQTIQALARVPGLSLSVVTLTDGSDLGSAGARNITRRTFVERYAYRRCRALRLVPRSELDLNLPVVTPLHGLRDDESIGTQFHPDLVVTFGEFTPPRSLLTRLKYGVWGFDALERRRAGGPPLAFKEMYAGQHHAHMRLVRFGPSDIEGSMLAETVVALVPHSYCRSIDGILFSSTDLPSRACRMLTHDVLPAVEPEPLDNRGGPVSFVASATLASRISWNLMRSLVEFLARDHRWGVGVVGEPVGQFLLRDAKPHVNWLPEPKRNVSLADPFGIQRGNIIVLMVESFDHETRRGELATTCAGENVEDTPPRTVISAGTHLAYPYLVQYGGEIYCVPDNALAREIVMYRALAFPDRWERFATLLENVAALDSTIFEHDGRWWLLYTDRDTGKDDKLHALHASTPFGPWTPHALNPIKSDVRSSRPAGPPFHDMGQLYRPAQDCSRTYGGAVAINHVLRLTPTAFEEQIMGVVEPDRRGPYPAGLHTLTAVDGYTLIDGKRYVWSFRGMSRKIGHILRRLRS